MALVLLWACESEQRTYDEMLKQISESANTIELSSADGQERILLSEELQGRVLTSTFDGREGKSIGWINPAIWDVDTLTGALLHGEERTWIGPLGGQFSFYYGQQEPLSEENWSVPTAFNDEAFRIVSFDRRTLSFEKKMRLTNFQGNPLNMLVRRHVNLLSHHEIAKNLSMPIWDNDLKVVAYEIETQLYNSDSVKWTKESGLASIWELTTLPGSDQSFVVVPLKDDNDTLVKSYLNSDDMQRIKHQKDALFYKVDGKYRHKIGLGYLATKGLMASFCPQNKLLTIIQFQQSAEDSLYFNSEVKEQENPYQGETISVYNHGNMDLTRSDQNAFYEMETASAMRELEPGECLDHYHRVYHFGGDNEKLNELAEKVLGVSL